MAGSIEEGLLEESSRCPVDAGLWLAAHLIKAAGLLDWKPDGSRIEPDNSLAKTAFRLAAAARETGRPLAGLYDEAATV